MKHKRTKGRRVAAVFPSSQGFGFAVFEGSSRLLDWGVKSIPSREQAESLKKLGNLLDWYEPHVLVLENFAGEGSRKGERTSALIRAMARMATKCHIRFEGYSRARIREAFSEYGAFKKDEIVLVIAKKFPVLEPRIPPIRKPWMAEHHNMAIFDAAALAFTFFHFEREGTEVHA